MCKVMQWIFTQNIIRHKWKKWFKTEIIRSVYLHKVQKPGARVTALWLRDIAHTQTLVKQTDKRVSWPLDSLWGKTTHTGPPAYLYQATHVASEPATAPCFDWVGGITLMHFLPPTPYKVQLWIGPDLNALVEGPRGSLLPYKVNWIWRGSRQPIGTGQPEYVILRSLGIGKASRRRVNTPWAGLWTCSKQQA